MSVTGETSGWGSGAPLVRMVASTAFGGLFWVMARSGDVTFPAWPVLLALAVLWWGGSRTPRPSSLVSVLQIGFDLALIGTLVAATGGTDSALVLLFVVPILVAGVVSGPSGAAISALMACLSFTAVATLVGGDSGPLTSAEIAYEVGLHGGAFLILAVAVGSLAERGRRSGVEAQAATEELERVRVSTDRILEHMPIGILTASTEGRIMRVNHAARDILAIPRDTVLTARDLGGFLQELSPSLVEAMEAVLTTPKWSVREEILLRRDQQDRPIGVSFAPLVHEDDSLEGLIVTFADLSHVRRMEREMRRSEQLAALGELAAGVAHEIRNPLASISGAVQVLREEEGRDEESTELMNLIVSESDRLNRIIDGVLDYTRDHSGSRTVYDVRRTVEEVVRLLRHDKSLTMGKTILVEFADGPDFLAEVEENGLKQVFLNLARNAMQAMGVGGILRVTGEEADGRVFVVFRDTGDGIPRHDLENIFKPFHTTKKGGTGLGLPIAARIVEGNGGVIRVRSTPGLGTAFTVELPKPPQEEGSTVALEAPMTENRREPAGAN